MSATEPAPAFGRILVALDGSALAERILPYVEALAAPFHAEIILLRAVTSPETYAIQEAEAVAATPLATPAISPELDPYTLSEEEQRDAAGYLGAIAERFRRRGLAVQIEEPASAAADAIITTAAQDRVDLIALTTHGRSGLARVVLGSVADAVVRRATCPILLVRVVEE